MPPRTSLATSSGWKKAAVRALPMRSTPLALPATSLAAVATPAPPAADSFSDAEGSDPECEPVVFVLPSTTTQANVSMEPPLSSTPPSMPTQYSAWGSASRAFWARFLAPCKVSASVMGWSATPDGTLRPVKENFADGNMPRKASVAAEILTGFREATTTRLTWSVISLLCPVSLLSTRRPRRDCNLRSKICGERCLRMRVLILMIKVSLYGRRTGDAF